MPDALALISEQWLTLGMTSSTYDPGLSTEPSQLAYLTDGVNRITAFCLSCTKTL